MRKLALFGAAVLGAALLVLGTASTGSAYPDLTCDLTVNRQTVPPGETFTAVGTAAGADSTEPVRWTFAWNGVTRHRTGAMVEATFTAPHVHGVRVIRLSGEATASLGGSERTCVHHIDITVGATQVSAPGSSESGSGVAGLVNTGGPALWLLVAAIALLLAGGGAVVAGRRHTD